MKLRFQGSPGKNNGGLLCQKKTHMWLAQRYEQLQQNKKPADLLERHEEVCKLIGCLSLDWETCGANWASPVILEGTKMHFKPCKPVWITTVHKKQSIRTLLYVLINISLHCCGVCALCFTYLTRTHSYKDS